MHVLTTYSKGQVSAGACPLSLRKRKKTLSACACQLVLHGVEDVVHGHLANFLTLHNAQLLLHVRKSAAGSGLQHRALMMPACRHAAGCVWSTGQRGLNRVAICTQLIPQYVSRPLLARPQYSCHTLTRECRRFLQLQCWARTHLQEQHLEGAKRDCHHLHHDAFILLILDHCGNFASL